MEALFEQVESELLRGLFKYLVTEEVSRELEQFLDKHCEEFDGEISDLTGEQDLYRYDLYKKYTALLDNRVKTYAKKQGFTVKEIYSECEAACVSDKDEANITSMLLDMLVSASDYQMFVINMSTFKRYKDVKRKMAEAQAEIDEREVRDSQGQRSRPSGRGGKYESKYCDDYEPDSDSDDDEDHEYEGKSNFESKCNRGETTVSSRRNKK